MNIFKSLKGTKPLYIALYALCFFLFTVAIACFLVPTIVRSFTQDEIINSTWNIVLMCSGAVLAIISISLMKMIEIKARNNKRIESSTAHKARESKDGNKEG